MQCICQRVEGAHVFLWCVYASRVDKHHHPRSCWKRLLEIFIMDERNVAPMYFFHKKNAITKVSLQAKKYIACIKGFFWYFCVGLFVDIMLGKEQYDLLIN